MERFLLVKEEKMGSAENTWTARYETLPEALAAWSTTVQGYQQHGFYRFRRLPDWADALIKSRRGAIEQWAAYLVLGPNSVLIYIMSENAMRKPVQNGGECQEGGV